MEMEHVKKYRLLPEPGKQAVDTLIDSLLSMSTEQRKESISFQVAAQGKGPETRTIEMDEAKKKEIEDAIIKAKYIK